MSLANENVKMRMGERAKENEKMENENDAEVSPGERNKPIGQNEINGIRSYTKR